MHSRHQTLFRILFVWTGYLLLASLGSAFSTMYGFSSPVWLASGFAIFCVTICGYKYSLLIMLAACTKSLIFGQPFSLAFIIATGPALEAILGRWLFLKILKQRSLLIFHNRLIAVVVAAAVSSAVSASIGMATLEYFRDLTGDEIFNGWLTWYGGDVVGNLLLFPLLLNLRGRIRIGSRMKSTEWVVILLTSLAFLGIAFNSRYSTNLMMLLPVMVFIIFKFGSTVGLLTANIVALICCLTLVVKKGPFILGFVSVNLFSCILYLVTLGLVVLALVSFQRAQALKTNIKLLFACWAIAYIGGLTLEIVSEKNDRSHFMQNIEFAKKNIQIRFDEYQTVLRGAGAFYRASDQVTKADWKVFSSEFDVSKLLPGATGLAFIEPVLKKDIPKIIENNKRLGIKNFEVKSFKINSNPVVGAQDYFLVKFYEPDEQGQAHIGLDIGSEVSRRKAAEYARDTGQTGIVTSSKLLTDSKGRTGFLILAPVYKQDNLVESVELKREKFLGWTAIPFVTEEYLNHALSEELKEIDIRLIDQENSVVIFDSCSEDKAPVQEIIQTIELAQKSFTLIAHPNKNFQFTFGRGASILSSITVIFSIFLAMIMVNLQLTNRRITLQVRSKTQELLRAQQMAEIHLAKSVEASRLASLGEMAGGIAHEINNPLSIILAKVFNLKSRLRKGSMSSDEILPYIDKVEQTSYRIAKIVKGMKNLTRDGSNFDFEKIPLLVIVEDVLDVCREKFRNKGIEIRVSVASQLFVNCRFIQISQVLINLLNNSEHAIEHQSHPWVEVRSFEDNTSVGIEVIDSGKGIPDEVVSRMMDPFFTTKEVGKGTGLGLSIAQTIMKEHDGSLDYIKDRAHTTFRLRFPKWKA